jgi:hypothetical protein
MHAHTYTHKYTHAPSPPSPQVVAGELRKEAEWCYERLFADAPLDSAMDEVPPNDSRGRQDGLHPQTIQPPAASHRSQSSEPHGPQTSDNSPQNHGMQTTVHTTQAAATMGMEKRIGAIEAVLSLMRVGEPVAAGTSDRAGADDEDDDEDGGGGGGGGGSGGSGGGGSGGSGLKAIFEMGFIRYFRKELWGGSASAAGGDPSLQVGGGAGGGAAGGGAAGPEDGLSIGQLRALSELDAQYSHLQMAKVAVLGRVAKHLVPSDDRRARHPHN